MLKRESINARVNNYQRWPKIVRCLQKDIAAHTMNKFFGNQSAFEATPPPLAPDPMTPQVTLVGKDASTVVDRTDAPDLGFTQAPAGVCLGL